MIKKLSIRQVIILLLIISFILYFLIQTSLYRKVQLGTSSMQVETNIYLGDSAYVRSEKATIDGYLGSSGIYKGKVASSENITELKARFYFDENEKRTRIFFYIDDNPIHGENCKPESFFISLESSDLNNIEDAVLSVNTDLPIHVYFFDMGFIIMEESNLTSCIARDFPCTRKVFLGQPITKNKIYGYLWYADVNVDSDFNVSDVLNTDLCINSKKKILPEEDAIRYCIDRGFLSKRILEGKKEIKLFVNDVLIHTIMINFDKEISKEACKL